MEKFTSILCLLFCSLIKLQLTVLSLPGNSQSKIPGTKNKVKKRQNAKRPGEKHKKRKSFVR